MTPTLEIASLDMEARGVGHLPNEDGSPGKVIFVEGALPGELVRFTSYRRKPKWEAAELTELLRSSALRTSPKCHYFGICGGCAMQHLHPSAQVAIKQRVLEDNLFHIGRVRPHHVLRPIHGPDWGYRYRARLSVRFVEKKGGVLIGFHERRSSFIADMRTCEILPPKVSAMLQPMRGLIGSLSIRDRLPQIELAVGEREAEFKFEHQDEQVIVLVLRIMAPLSNEDEHLLKAFADQWGIEWWLQTKGPDTAMPWYPQKHPLQYRLPEFGVIMPFKPTDFTQVNHQINSVLVSRALRLLQVQPTDRVADLFCGLGNFTLPLATQAREVLGIEGSSALTERAVSNAKLNGLDQKTFFSSRNLFEFTLDDLRALGKFDRMLIDPPREGAMEVCKAIAEAKEQAPDVQPARIVYVSCNPATLARDAGMLVNVGGYQLSQAGVVNMFPHTAHVESIAVFDRPS
ncbi:MAG: 23S rRNA (uracil(1939)-C(5))-methyltransferase RlmD [Burkholderiales bacterium]|nr:23S rRNA (uracil(1939)-C(5))-methyltransferase RlmD [Burkholderiales bacterium]